MLSGWKKLLQDVTESVSNLASNAVADATITASLALPTIQLSNESDAWRSLGAHQRACLLAISDNQNKNHAASGRTSALLASACSKLQAQDSLADSLQQDIHFVAASKSCFSSQAAELAIMSRELVSLTNFLAVFREAHIARTATRLKSDADAELLRAQKNSHARITAASRARDLNLNKSIHAVKAAISVPTAGAPSSAASQIVVDTDGGMQSALKSEIDRLPTAESTAHEVDSALTSRAATGDSVIVDFEELLRDEPPGKLPIAAEAAAEETSAGE
jgi:hypothetical protein